MLIVKFKAFDTFEAEQFLPPEIIPSCMTASQTSEGFWHGECNQGITYLPGDWCVKDAEGSHFQYTDEQFLELFETVI